MATQTEDRAALRVRPAEAPRAELSRVDRLRAARAEAAELVELQADPVLHQVLSDAELAADRRVAETVRARARAEQRRAGLAQVRAARAERSEGWWLARARRARDRRTSPDRRLVAVHRRHVALTTATFLLLVAGIAWTSITVHDGLVGVHGSWTGYLVEPLASVLLVVSMFAQFTAVENGQRVARAWIALDVALVGASLALNIVPWGFRYGWDAGSLLGHVLPPALIAAAVVVHHLLTRLFGELLAELSDPGEFARLSEETTDVVWLVGQIQAAMHHDLIPVDRDGDELPSKEAIRKYLRIGNGRAQRTRDALVAMQP